MRVLHIVGFGAYVLTVYSPFYVAARSQEGPSMLLRTALASAALYAVQDRAQELIDAVLAADVGEVSALLEAGVDANTRNDEGVWALILAAGSGPREVAAVLLEAGAWVNLTGPNGSAALAASAKGGHVEMTRDLLKASAEVDAQNKMGVTALMVAARNGNPETIEALLDGGADVNVETEYGANALRIAVMENHVPATMQLLLAGANAENIKGQETLLTNAIRDQLDGAEMPRVSTENVTAYALVVASRKGSREIFEKLTKYGVKAEKEPQGATFGSGAYRTGYDITPPILRKQVRPQYTQDALTKKIEGTVDLEVVILKEGRVGEVRVVQGLGGGLTDQAINCVRQWVFIPAKLKGAPVDVIAGITVDFAIYAEREDVQVPLRVGGDIKPPEKIKDVPPKYPKEAKEAGVQGIVILEGIIDHRGNVTDVRVLRSIPLLDQAAIDAVKQWKYEPTLLEGLPVPIVMTVTVNFTLS